MADDETGDEGFEVVAGEFAATVSAKCESGATVCRVGDPETDTLDSVALRFEVVNHGKTRLDINEAA